MKTCPECGSTLADNEPYCENCGFGPGFDSGSWNYGQRKYARKYYGPGKSLKNQGHLLEWYLAQLCLL